MHALTQVSCETTYIDLGFSDFGDQVPPPPEDARLRPDGTGNALRLPTTVCQGLSSTVVFSKGRSHDR